MANYGTGVLKDYGTYLRLHRQRTPVSGLSALQTDIQQTMASSKQSVLWFEALFSTQATTVSQQDAAPLVNGSMSPSAFMSDGAGGPWSLIPADAGQSASPVSRR